MGFLDKLLHRTPTATLAPPPEAAACLHGALVPRWDNVADMGKEEKATSYRCDSCGKDFTPEEAHGVWSSAADRLRRVNELPPSN
ncbi:MAG TPA: hypothetical protein VK821_05975 [Dehalococcoidia bacterium]|nr:hypothetical protein [Dehalococcoidia bacterium]